MRILSLDQSTACTGYALFNDTDLLRWGVIDCHKIKDSTERVESMIIQMCELIEESKCEYVVFENIQMQTSVQTVMLLARLQGAIIYYCAAHHIPYMMYLPTQWRKIIGFNQGQGHNRSDLKQQAIEYIKESYRIHVKDDVAESITIGLAYLKDHDMLPDLENLKRSRKDTGEKPLIKGDNTDGRTSKKTKSKKSNK